MRYPIRLTKLQVAILYVALRQIYFSNIDYDNTGYTRDCHPEAPRSCNPQRFGSSDPEFIKTFLDLWQQIKPIRDNGGRIYIHDAFGLAACIFAVRVTVKKIRHGHHEAWTPGIGKAADHLAARLERERKRLKRVMISGLGEDAYQAKARRWTSFIRFLHFHYVYCGCAYRRRNNLYLLRKLTIDQFVTWTSEALLARGEAVPSNLRALIRQLVRYIRRERTALFVRDLSKNLAKAKYVFSAFVLHRYFPKSV